MKCEKCGKEYEGTVCPNCGVDNEVPVKPKKKFNILKKWWFWVAIGVTLFIIGTAVGNDKPSKETSGSDNESGATVVTQDETFKVGETAVFRDLKITANEVKTSAGESFLEPEKGNEFVGVKFTIENISDEDQSISSILLFDAYVDGVKCDYSFTANCVFDDGDLDGELSPGKKMVGYYAVEVSKDWQELELQVKSDWLSDNKAVFVFNK